MAADPGRPAVRGLAERVAGAEADRLGSPEQEMVRRDHLVGSEIGFLDRPPADALQAQDLPGGQAAEPHQAAPAPIMAVVDLADMRPEASADVDSMLAAFHGRSVLVVGNAPEHRVPAHHDRGAACPQEIVERPIGLLGPVLAMAVDDDDLVAFELARIEVQIVIAGDVVCVAVAFEPAVGEQFASHQVAVVQLVLAEDDFGAGDRPGQAHADRVRRLPGRMVPVAAVGRR